MNTRAAEPRTYGEECDGCRGPDAAAIDGFRKVLRTIAGKWKIDIVCALVEGPLRFGALRRALPGITQHMLTEQLRDLEWNGIVIRRAHDEVPPRVEYALSRAGVELVPIFQAMLAWSAAYAPLLRDGAPPATAPEPPQERGVIRHVIR